MRLQAAASAIVDALGGDGVNVYPFEPDTVSAPAAYLGPPRQVIVDQSTRIGCFWLRELPITLVIARQSERDVWRRLDEMEAWFMERIERNPALNEFGTSVRTIEQARPVQIAGANYVAEDVVLQVVV